MRRKMTGLLAVAAILVPCWQLGAFPPNCPDGEVCDLLRAACNYQSTICRDCEDGKCPSAQATYTTVPTIGGVGPPTCCLKYAGEVTCAVSYSCTLGNQTCNDDWDCGTSSSFLFSGESDMYIQGTVSCGGPCAW